MKAQLLTMSTPDGPFTILEFSQDQDPGCVYIETRRRSLWQEDPEDITEYRTVFHHLVDSMDDPKGEPVHLMAQAALLLANDRLIDLAILDWNLGAGDDRLFGGPGMDRMVGATGDITEAKDRERELQSAKAEMVAAQRYALALQSIQAKPALP